jgi:hypothetical protein
LVEEHQAFNAANQLHEAVDDIASAIAREADQSGFRQKKIDLVNGMNPQWRIYEGWRT